LDIILYPFDHRIFRVVSEFLPGPNDAQISSAFYLFFFRLTQTLAYMNSSIRQNYFISFGSWEALIGGRPLDKLKIQ